MAESSNTVGAAHRRRPGAGYLTDSEWHRLKPGLPRVRRRLEFRLLP
jgi:hypothetical protein